MRSSLKFVVDNNKSKFKDWLFVFETLNRRTKATSTSANRMAVATSGFLIVINGLTTLF